MIQPTRTHCHTEHSTTLTWRKCTMFYEAYIKLSPIQAATLMEETKIQSASQLWHDAWKLRLTASTAKREPQTKHRRSQKMWIWAFVPNLYWQYSNKAWQGKLGHVITLLESRGHVVENRGLVVHPDHPWLVASPDRILDATQLLEIKCPFKSSTSLTEFLSQPNGDIKSLDDG
jgi:hypothetical protein